jgi:polysaccharide chain length determinant protein (PEP-CTERM system associated)
MVPQKELTVEDYITILRRRWILIACFSVAGLGLGVAATQMLPKKFKSETVVLVEEPAVKIVTPVVDSDTNQRLATMQQQILSRSRLEPIIRKLSLYGDDLNRVSMDDLVLGLRKNIEVTPVQPMARTNAPGLPGFTISVTFADPAMAQKICSTITSMFLDENSVVRQQQSQETTEFLRSQLAAAEADMNAQDAALAAFQKNHLGELPDDRAMNLNVLNGLAAQLDAVTQALGRAQQDKTFAESSLAEQVATWKASQEGHNPETQQQQIAAMEAQLAVLKSKYTDDHPDVARLKRDIAAAKKLAEASGKTAAPVESQTGVQTEPAAMKTLRDQIHQLDQTIQDRTAQQEDLHRRIKLYQSRMESSPAVEQEAKSLTRGQKAAQESYDELKKQLEKAEMATRLETEQQGEQFKILEPANFPLKPFFPDVFKFSVGGLAGGIALSLGLTLLLEMRDTSVRSDKELEALIHLPVLVVVPALSSAAGKVKGAPSNLVAGIRTAERT